MKHDVITTLNTLIKTVTNIGKRQNSDVSGAVLFSIISGWCDEWWIGVEHSHRFRNWYLPRCSASTYGLNGCVRCVVPKVCSAVPEGSATSSQKIRGYRSVKDTLQFTYLLTYLLTHSMERSPSWEANRFAASQDIARNLWNPKDRYRIHKCPPPVPILSQLDPVHTYTSHFLKIHLNIFLPSTFGALKWPFSFRFPNQTPLYSYSLPHTRYMLRPSQSSRFYHPNNIGWGVQIVKLLIVQFTMKFTYFLNIPLELIEELK